MRLKIYVASRVKGTPLDDLFQVSYGLLERPSDFGFTSRASTEIV